ncbi:hypothetical protein AYO22_00834 [Fonsecaea multimorphosa]|nr:hypothetical protein AYO22_00834 [Fonsecaea multimorphosa]
MDERPYSCEEADEHIKQIRRTRGVDNDGIQNITSANLEDLEASISILAEGLYEKSTHFLLELIQNADDCAYDTPTPRMLISYLDERLRLDYNEVGFTRRDVEALCRIGRTTKSNSGNKIGEKGIGFKSVFKIADVVSILSGYYSFKFDRTKSNLGMITPECDAFPAKTDLVDEMRSMDPRCLLFLRNLKQIHVTVSPPDDHNWEITLSRIDDQSGDEALRTTTLSYGDKSVTYLVHQHIATSLPDEQKRRGREMSAILLAFPHNDAPETELEQQQVYAFLPIRNYGFTFLIHADFLLIANRGDIDSSSQWNLALREAILDAFLKAVLYLHGTAFRYTWPRYLPSGPNTFDFFWKFRTALAVRLLKMAIIETEDGQLKTPTTVRYVPRCFRDENNVPLISSAATKSKYLSHKYSASDIKRLRDIGVTTLSDEEFLDDLRGFLSGRNAAMPEAWHSNIARALLPLTTRFKRKISDLNLILLSNGRRVAASASNIFFPGSSPDNSIPAGIEVFEVHRDISKDHNCQQLYALLGIKQITNPFIQKLILKKHLNDLSGPKTPLCELLSQAHFLFKSGWTNPIDHFWVVTTTGGICRSQEVYVDTDENEKYSASRYLDRKEFPFLNQSYDKGIASEEFLSWRTWLRKTLGLWKIPRLVKTSGNIIHPELSNDFRYILKECSSRQFLVLLKQNWPLYSEYISQTQLSAVRSELSSVRVDCRDGSQHDLKATSTGYFMPEEFRSEYTFLPPILDIPNPQDDGWTFLKVFGVTVNRDLNTYLGILRRIQGRKVSVDFVRWLYERIQGQCEDNPVLVFDTFVHENLVYIPSSSMNDLPNWVNLNKCVWTGPICLMQSHKLSEIHPDHRILFVKYLKVNDAGFETLVLEAKAITPSLPLAHIAGIFKELSKLLPDPVSVKATDAIRSLLALNIFPLDEGGDSSMGFDELSSGTAESEWYIADQAHLRQCFQARVSLLAFAVEDVQAILRLLVRERQQILHHLENVEIWHADSILGGWDIETKNPTSGVTHQESTYLDTRLQALLVPPTETDRLRIYLRDGLSCPPLELAEQLAAFCGVQDCEALILNIMGQASSTIIEDTLNRRGIPEKREKIPSQAGASPYPAAQHNEGKASANEQSSASAEKAQVRGTPRRFQEKWVGAGADEGQQEDEEPPLKSIIHDEVKIDIDELGMQRQSWEDLPDVNPTDNQDLNEQRTRPAASTKRSVNGENIMSKSKPVGSTLPKESSSRRPNYVPLVDAPTTGEYVLPRGESSRRKRKAVARGGSHGIEALEHPRIVGYPNYIYVTNCEELPPENFSDQPLGGIVLPGRAQISRSGECTVFLAVEPAYKVDSHTEFLGELYVSQLFKRYLGRRYDPDTHWTSRYRREAGHTSFQTEKQSTATFTFSDGSAMTEFLIQSGSGFRRNGDYPNFHIFVKTTNGGQESLFTIRADEMEMIRRYRLLPEDKRPSQVIILVRVYDMESTASASFFIDPWRMYAAGEIQIYAQNGSYIAKTQLASPNLLFKHFEMGFSAPPFLQFLTSYVRDSGELWERRRVLDDERKYKYEPLEKGAFMRLLRLHPGRGLKALKGKLERVSLEDTKQRYPFTALSYVWGNSLKPYVLAIEGYALRITASLYFALKQLREEKHSILVWADAICIDQDNDIEKGHQVRLMSKIYKSAMRVCAWLGNEADQSNFAIDWLCKIKRTAKPRIEVLYQANTAAQRELLSLLKDFEHTRSSRRRDKLFAFLGLACDADDSGLDPDYAAPLETVVSKYAAVFVRRGRGMELLYHAGATNLEADARFPSWVPNWVTTTYPRTITTWKSRSGLFSACSHRKDTIRVSPQNGSILTATAYDVDGIAEVGEISFAAGDRTRWLKEVFRFIERVNTYPTKDNPKDLFWKVPIGDALDPPSGSWNEVDFRGFRVSYEALAEFLQMDNDPSDWNVEVAKMRSVAKMKQFFFRPQELRKMMWPFLLTAEEFAQRFVDAKVCRTEKGYIGIVPGAARKGSRVALFLGSAVPFVIDKGKKHPNCYRHLGECYIHGIMHGAANQKSGLFKKPPQDIHLC